MSAVRHRDCEYGGSLSAGRSSLRPMRAGRYQIRSNVMLAFIVGSFALIAVSCGGDESARSVGSAGADGSLWASSDATAPLSRLPLAARDASPSTTSLVATGHQPPPVRPTTEPTSSTDGSPAAAPTVVSTAASSTLAPPSGRVTMAWSGDVLAHRAINRGALQPDGTYNYAPMFANVASLVSSVDLAICHLESPVGPNGEVIVEPERIAVAASIGVALASAGYDRCSTASNHSLNGGVSGVEATIDALAAAGLGQSGMASNADEVLPAILEINGVRVAHLAYAYGFDGDRAPAGEEWRANLIDPAQILSDAQAERARGAEVVVVSLHWGSTRAVQATAKQRRIAEVITASGAIDIIVGHHAHVLQPIEQVNGVWVVWGLGNHLSNHPTSSEWPVSTQDGAIVTIAVQRRPDGTIVVEQPVVYPTWCDREHGWVIRLTTEADDPNLSGAVRDELRKSQKRTAELLGWFLAVP